MRELATIQQIFSAALLDPGQTDAATALFAGAMPRVRERLAIYRGNSIANTAKALAGAYPIIGKLVGNAFFDGLARAYRRSDPPTSGDLNDFGAQFAAFLTAFPHARSLPYLPDVARLEWLAHRAHYAADEGPFAIARLKNLAGHNYAGARVRLHPAVAVLESRYPLYRIWEVHQDDYRGEIAVDLDSGPQCVLVYRPRFRSAVAWLTAGEFAFLSAVAQHATLGTALQSALAADAQFDLAASLQRWVAANVIVDVGALPPECAAA
jgi:hypothetical protein